jgi:hypothetical protein
MSDDTEDRISIALAKPILFPAGANGVSYETVDLREPTAAEWEQWDALTGVAANIKAIHVISGLPEGAVKQMGVRDFNRAVAFINRFF